MSATIVTRWFRIWRTRNTYRPERHYFRGPGPKCREKSVGIVSMAKQEVDLESAPADSAGFRRDQKADEADRSPARSEIKLDKNENGKAWCRRKRHGQARISHRCDGDRPRRPALGPARGQSFPSRAIRIVVPTPAAAPPDVLARVIGNALAEAEGWTVVVENKPGGAMTIGATDVLRQPADGHTLLSVTTPIAAAPSLVPSAQRRSKPISRRSSRPGPPIMSWW